MHWSKTIYPFHRGDILQVTDNLFLYIYFNKINNMKKLFLLLFIIPILSFGQNKTENSSGIFEESDQDTLASEINLKRFSLGLKLGIPNIASVGVQYTLPFLNNHLAPYIDYSSYSFMEDGTGDFDLSFAELGLSYYFNEKGRGAYLALGLSNLSLKGSYNNIDLNFGGTGSGSSKVDLSTTNLKFGIKTGGTIYFRMELGYGFGNLPQTVSFTAVDNSNPLNTEIAVEEIPEIPGITDSGMLVGNIGFGFSF